MSAAGAGPVAGSSSSAGSSTSGGAPPIGGGGQASGGTGQGAGGSSGASSGGSAGNMSMGGRAGGGTAGSNNGGSNNAGSGNGGSNNAGSGNGGSSNGGAGTAGAAGNGGMSGGGDVVGLCKDDYLPAANNGSVTRYDFVQGTSLPACAYVITHKGAGSDGDWDTVEGISTGDGGYFGAMNTSDYNKGAVCGACAEITYNGSKKVVITVVDECPIGSNNLCVKGHIDLSRKAIRQLQPDSKLERLGNGGNGSISWRYVTCPAVGNVKLRLHPQQNANWQPVVVENGLYPLKSVTINGVNAVRAGNGNASDAAGNAWLANGQKLPYTVRATDLNGDTIQTNFSGGSSLVDSGKQFMCKK